MNNTIIIGKNSIIYSDIKSRLKLKNIYEFSHDEIPKIKRLKIKINYIIYFGFDDSLFKSIDRQVIEFAKNKNIHLIYFSTRKVYKKYNKGFIYNEKSELFAVDNYAKVKLFNENLIYKNLKKFTILRLGTYIPKNIMLCINKKSFIGIFLNNLKKNLIEFDFDSTVEKDFLFSGRFIAVLRNIISSKLIGTYNVSSGRSIVVNDIINLLNFKKSLKVIIKKNKKNESFILENYKVNKKLKLNYKDISFQNEFDEFIKNLIKIINSS